MTKITPLLAMAGLPTSDFNTRLRACLFYLLRYCALVAKFTLWDKPRYSCHDVGIVSAFHTADTNIARTCVGAATGPIAESIHKIARSERDG